jgi:hypothetical protein
MSPEGQALVTRFPLETPVRPATTWDRSAVGRSGWEDEEGGAAPKLP